MTASLDRKANLDFRNRTAGVQMDTLNQTQINEISQTIFRLHGTTAQIAPFSVTYPGFDLHGAYSVVAKVRDMRKARGETPVGRKIGFTNRAVWTTYSISGPIWNYVFDTTVQTLVDVRNTFDATQYPEPRIEPELIIHLANAPDVEMDDHELIRCVDWVSHGFEIVHSVFPNWQFSAADAAAAYGVHSALLLGDKLDICGDYDLWLDRLSSFSIELIGGDGIVRKGDATNVLGGPLKALRFLLEEIERYPGCERVSAGEVVTTGTLTEAMPAVSGDVWRTRLSGGPLPGVALKFD